ncbi:MAG: cysteine synthase A [Tissierellia bacterium]|nr:cysteine synthase A [Tissierellia bacterium]
MIYQSIEELIGHTPLVELKKTQEALGLKARILVKLESYNPLGSMKDRVALSMLKEAEEAGQLTKNSVIIEPTSGNTGIGLCAVAAYKGYPLKIVMPENMSLERQKLMAFFGADLILTEASKGMAGAIEKAQALAQEIPGAFIPSQFDNPANPQAHYETTGPEIWEDSQGQVDILIASVGTGGSLSGTGAFLKEKNPKIQVLAVEPESSPVLSQGKKGPHKIQGIGAGFVPKTLNTQVYDRVLLANYEKSLEASRNLAKTEGYLVGISSGAVLSLALEEAKKLENQGKTLVALLPDTGERYLSTDLFPHLTNPS